MQQKLIKLISVLELFCISYTRKNKFVQSIAALKSMYTF